MTSLDPTKQFGRDRVCVATPTLPQAPQPPNQGKRLVSLGGYASARSSESSDSVDRISGLTALLSTCRGLSRLVSDDPEPRRIVDVIVQGRKPSSRVE